MGRRKLKFREFLTHSKFVFEYFYNRKLSLKLVEKQKNSKVFMVVLSKKIYRRLQGLIRADCDPRMGELWVKTSTRESIGK